MSKQKKKNKEKSKTTRINELKAEIKANDEMLKKNKDKRKLQIQIGLIKAGFPPSSGMYDILTEKLEFDLKINKICIDSKYEVVNPTFKFQADPEWQKLQVTRCINSKEENEANLKTVKESVAKVEAAIDEQNERIVARRLQIIDELKKLKQDVSEFEKTEKKD